MQWVFRQSFGKVFATFGRNFSELSSQAIFGEWKHLIFNSPKYRVNILTKFHSDDHRELVEHWKSSQLQWKWRRYLPQQILTSSAWSLQQYTRNCLRYLDIFRKWMDILCMLVNMQIGCNDNCMNALCFGYLMLKLGSNSLHFILLCTQRRCRRDDVWISDSQIAIFRWNVKIALNTWMTNDFPPTV